MRSPYHDAPPVDPQVLDAKAPLADPTFTGQARVPAGTAAAPGLTVAGDTNTGLFAPAADTLAMAAGGTERLRLSPDGTVTLAMSAGTGSLQVAPLAGAANSLRVTGGLSGQPATLQAQGSDANVNVRLLSKGVAGFYVQSHSGANTIFAVAGRYESTPGNYPQFSPAASGGAVTYGVEGVDATVDLALAPKGAAGRLRFGAYTAQAGLSVAGFIEIRDAGGTIRRLAVVE